MSRLFSLLLMIALLVPGLNVPAMACAGADDAMTTMAMAATGHDDGSAPMAPAACNMACPACLVQPATVRIAETVVRAEALVYPRRAPVLLTRSLPPEVPPPRHAAA